MNEELKIVITAVVNEAKQQIRAATKELDFFRSKTTETALAQEQLTQKVKQQKQELALLQANYNKIVGAQGKESAAATACATQIATLSASYASNVATLEANAAASLGYRASLGAISTASDKTGKAAKGASAELQGFHKAIDENTQLIRSETQDAIKNLCKTLEKLEKVYEQCKKELGENHEIVKALEAIDNEADAIVGALEGVDDAAIDAGNSIKNNLGGSVKNLNKVQQEAENTGKSFERMKKVGATTGKALSAAMKTVAIAVAAVSAATIGLAEGTREYRTEQAKLTTAFEAAGSTAEQAKKTYNDLYRVLGESDTAVEAANHLGQLTQDQKELAEWTKICQGVYATFGDSLPIESLTEAINETAKTGEITGALADAVNWAGMSEDEFADALFWCNSEAEREQLIRDTLNGLYGEAAEGYEETAASILAANEAQAALTESMAALGAAVEPIITLFKAELATTLQNLAPSFQLVADGITEMTQGVEGGAEKMTQGIKGMIDTVLATIVALLPGLLEVGTQIIFAILDGLTAAFPDIIDTLATLIPQVITSLGALIPKITNAILKALPLIIKTIIQAAAQILVTLGEIIPEILDQIVAILPEVISAIVENVPVLLEAAVTFLMAIADAIPIIIPALLEELPMLIESILSVLVDNMPMMQDASVTLFMAIVNAIPVIIQSLINNLPKIIVSIVAALIQSIPQLYAGAVKMFMAIIQAIPYICSNLIGALPQIVSVIKSELADRLGKVFQGIWDKLVSVFTGGKGKLKSIFSDIAVSISNSFKTVFNRAINTVLSAGVNIINGFIRSINAAISVINAIPGVDIKKLNTLNVPKLERGGVLKKGQVGLLEGNGAEAVVPLEKNTQWLDEIAKRLNGATGNNPRIVLKVDGKTLGEIAADAINDLARQRGKTPLQVI